MRLTIEPSEPQTDRSSLTRKISATVSREDDNLTLQEMLDLFCSAMAACGYNTDNLERLKEVYASHAEVEVAKFEAEMNSFLQPRNGNADAFCGDKPAV